MKVHAVIFNPQGSIGGFDWFHDKDGANEWADDFGRDLVLGVIEVEVEDDLENEQVTDEIDARLPEIERSLGYDPAAYGNA